ncbi:hypothetical protein COLO4_00276 [Corchorus olitorius]|uniref:Uncharacterized protein n=1 Tax=Corchorus olitorius TaxID=93759 RepID=A0A1R3L461_9ROSI|nr:hypothetical protein COLO4_02316 [Corchorus olitorius]OMP14124.1 hypothetical protein COLO4_00276 [Corchorus olitorius]
MAFPMYRSIWYGATFFDWHALLPPRLTNRPYPHG